MSDDRSPAPQRAPAAPEDVRALATRRAEARAARDFATADALRREIADAGWTVVDEPAGGWHLEPVALEEPSTAPVRLSADSVSSLLEQPTTFDVSLHWLVEGWPEDVDRAITSFRAHESGLDVQYVVVDLTGQDPGRWGDDVEVVSLEEDTGWADGRSLGKVVAVLDGSVEATGPVLPPLRSALDDVSVGVCGPFGVVTHDLREFEEAPGPDVDAIEGYLAAFRRETLVAAGGFDRRFRWYRTADIDWSFRVKDLGFRAVVVDLPVTRHEHRAWNAAGEDERARLSKRNYYRFLEHYRDRWDLVLDPRPPSQPA
jgi:cysteinyl-tRNA synthetase